MRLNHFASLALGLAIFSTAAPHVRAQAFVRQPCSVQTYTAGTGGQALVMNPLGNLCVQVAPGTSGGVNVTRILAAASGVIKAAPGQAYSWHLQNTNAAIRYLQLYNKATAGIPGTDIPVDTIPFAIGGVNNGGGGGDVGEGVFTIGISWAITTDAAGLTAGASGDIVGAITSF